MSLTGRLALPPSLVPTLPRSDPGEPLLATSSVLVGPPFGHLCPSTADLLGHPGPAQHRLEPATSRGPRSLWPEGWKSTRVPVAAQATLPRPRCRLAWAGPWQGLCGLQEGTLVWGPGIHRTSSSLLRARFCVIEAPGAITDHSGPAPSRGDQHPSDAGSREQAAASAQTRGPGGRGF